MLRRRSAALLLCSVLLVLCATIEPVATPVAAQLQCPPNIEATIQRTASRTLDKVLAYYDSWAGKELKAGRKPGTGLTVAVAKGVLFHDPSFFAFWGAVRRLEQLGCNVIYMAGSSDTDMPGIVENLLAKNPDAIVCCMGNNQLLGPALEKAGKKKIPVFGIDNWLDGPTVVNEVSSNNFEIGIMATLYLVNELKGEGRVVNFFRPALRSVEIRHRMYHEVLKEFVRIQEVAELPYVTPQVTESARSRMEAILVANPNKGSINAVLSTNDLAALGAADAIEAAGRQDEIFVIGVDGEREVLRRIARGGALRATVSQDFLQISTASSLAVVDYLRGKTVPRFIYCPPVLVTRANVYQHYRDKFGEELKL